MNFVHNKLAAPDRAQLSRLLNDAGAAGLTTTEFSDRQRAVRTFLGDRLGSDGVRKLNALRFEIIDRNERAAAVLRNRINPEDLCGDPRIVEDQFVVSHMALDATATKSRRLLGKDDYLAYWAVVDRLSRVPNILQLLG